jgi:alpha-N-arabinofuranosidase
LFVAQGSDRDYDKSPQGAMMSGNVYTKGCNNPLPDNFYKNVASSQRPLLKDKTEANEWYAGDYDADARLIDDGKCLYLEILLDKEWVAARKRMLVTSAVLGNAVVPDLPFENPDGTSIRINTDYTGQERDPAHPSPGPFEIARSGRQRIKVCTDKDAPEIVEQSRKRNY